MNVLADKHHAGLFHSLQLLAGRLGWTLYTPVGLDWWTAGYWRFGQGYGDDRLAQQFLRHDFDVDGEFPDAPIATVTLEQAQAMDWDYVISSVPDNERGFWRFAQEHGAQFVEQVGNTGQWVDWSLDPLVLSSSEMPIEGRGVVYHQEMDPIAFAPPLWAHDAASFVNCMPSMGTCWDLLREAQQLAPIDVYGIDGTAGPEAIVKPNTRLIASMAVYGWGWHDKQQGDGFGHVIHSWAAVGRPLVGHASHYRGKMAESFWDDLVTCIDLDRHSVADAVDIIRTISPTQHEAMCREIRARFDAIDYDAEADAIRDLLGLAVPA
ncbi:MAG TPA: hypothetical protein VNM34_03385 [Verrucomicrobiae bacterium]|nr:hypothetical protein [Verrucomicrobiae bacterium]